MLHDPDQHGLQRGLCPEAGACAGMEGAMTTEGPLREPLDLFVFPHRKRNRPPLRLASGSRSCCRFPTGGGHVNSRAGIRFLR